MVLMSGIEPFLYDLAKATIALFIIVDPIGLIPVLLSLTRNITKEERKRVFRTATYTGSALLLVFALAGQQILVLFGISIHSFMIAGGTLLLLLAIEILIKDEWREKFASSENVGVVPIAFPLLAGPGAITTTMVTLQSSGILITIISISIVMMITWSILNVVDAIYMFLGRTGIAVIAKVMAVFIAAIAVQFILDGVLFYLRYAE